MSYEPVDDMAREADMIWALLDGEDQNLKESKTNNKSKVDNCACQQQDGVAVRLLKFLFGAPSDNHVHGPPPVPEDPDSDRKPVYHRSVYQPVRQPRPCPPPPPGARPKDPIYSPPYSDFGLSREAHEKAKELPRLSLVPQEEPRPKEPPPPPPAQTWPQEPLPSGHYVSDRAMGLIIGLTASAALILISTMYNAAKVVKQQFFPE